MDIQIGKGITIDADLAKLGFPGQLSTVAAHVAYIGLRNMLMDSHAGITTDEPDYQDKARAVAEKKLKAMYNGEVRVTGAREGDPVRAEAKRLAVAMIHAQAKKAGRKVSSLDKAKVNEAANGLITPELLAKAAERVAEAKALAGDVDVSGL
jgi:hypothetical protein